MGGDHAVEISQYGFLLERQHLERDIRRFIVGGDARDHNFTVHWRDNTGPLTELQNLDKGLLLTVKVQYTGY